MFYLSLECVFQLTLSTWWPFFPKHHTLRRTGWGAQVLGQCHTVVLQLYCH